MEKKVKIGLLGLGHLGSIHLKLLKEISEMEVVGAFDLSAEACQKASEQHGIKIFDSVSSLLAEVDAVDIVTPTLAHYDCACKALAADCHIFLEKPITHTPEEAEDLISRLSATRLKAQVGHVERFNPAFLATADMDISPMFIEGHRLATYNPRGTDVSVVLDLMIHDIDVVLSLVGAPLKKVSASGVAVVSDTPDIANARLEFKNGCVANLTASRISMKGMRKLRFFQKNAYISVDFLDKKTEIIKLTPDAPEEKEGRVSMEITTDKESKHLIFEKPEVRPVNAIKMELEEFAASILRNEPIRVSLRDGYKALKAAHEVVRQIEESLMAHTEEM